MGLPTRGSRIALDMTPFPIARPAKPAGTRPRLSRIGVLAVAFAACIVLGAHGALARTYTFSNTFVWEGTNRTTLQLFPPTAIANAQILGPNVDLDGPAIMDHTSQTCTFTTRMPVFGNSQRASGTCVTTDADGHLVFSRFSCEGTRTTCDGTIEFTGGTGKFVGVTGTAITRGVISEMEPNGPSRGRNFVQGTFTLPD